MRKLILVMIVLFCFGDLSSQDRVPVDSLKVSIENNCFFSLYNGIPFTGIGYSVYENGKLSGEVNLKDGKFDGLLEEWYENGQLKREIKYKEGKNDGLRKEWYENGQLDRIIKYKEGKKVGIYRGWYENGQLKKKKIIKKAKMME